MNVATENTFYYSSATICFMCTKHTTSKYDLYDEMFVNVEF